METNEEKVNQQINDCLSLLKDVLNKNLLGVYLYGSYILGGLEKYSDIDLFVVLDKPTTTEEKEKLINALLNISGIYMIDQNAKPLELTIVVQSDIKPWKYPPKFDFLYGDWLRKEFEKGNIEPWSSKISPNLALTITQMLLSNKVLLGLEPDKLIDQIPYKDFLEATTFEIDHLMNDLDLDTRNIILSLARIWCTLETDSIRSKSDASDFVINKLPNEYKQIVENAKSILHDEREDNWSGLENQIKPCAEYMVIKIKNLINEIKSSDLNNKTIKLK